MSCLLVSLLFPLAVPFFTVDSFSYLMYVSHLKPMMHLDWLIRNSPSYCRLPCTTRTYCTWCNCSVTGSMYHENQGRNRKTIRFCNRNLYTVSNDCFCFIWMYNTNITFSFCLFALSMWCTSVLYGSLAKHDFLIKHCHVKFSCY